MTSGERSDSLQILPSNDELIFGILLLVVLAAILVLVVVAARDMSRRGQSGLLWGLIVFVAPILGVLLWLALRKNWSVESATGAG